MQFSLVLSALALGFTASAAPTNTPHAATWKAVGQWTITSFTRVCNSANTSCNHSFGVNANNGTPVTKCAYTVNGNSASTASYGNVQCGPYVISSNHDPQGFQTLAVVNGQYIAFPSYSDADLASGKPVSPDRTFTEFNTAG